jgi:hypothetical protein
MYITRNIRWILMFLGQAISSRNIKTYVRRPDQCIEEHKTGIKNHGVRSLMQRRMFRVERGIKKHGTRSQAFLSE